MTAANLATYVLSDGIPPSEGTLAYIAQCWDEAAVLVAQYVSGEVAEGEDGLTITSEAVPAAILNRAVLQAGAELYERRKARSGISQFGTPDQSAPRLSRDPMEATYPILRPFVGLAIA